LNQALSGYGATCLDVYSPTAGSQVFVLRLQVGSAPYAAQRAPPGFQVQKHLPPERVSKTRKTKTQLFAFLSTFFTFVFFSRGAERRAKPEKPKLNFLRFLALFNFCVFSQDETS
jgi:hypothetical protein